MLNKKLIVLVLLFIFVGFVLCDEKTAETKKVVEKEPTSESQGDDEEEVPVNPSGHKNVQEVIDEVKKTHLRDFFIRNLNISSEEAKSIAKTLEEIPEMDRFALTSNSDLNTENLKTILAAIPKTKLRVIGITKNLQLGDEGVEAVANAIKDHPSIQKVYFFRVNMTEKGAKVLSEVLPTLKNLTKVVFVENHIGDEGAKVLSNFVQSSNLEWLTLRDCAIKSEGFKVLLPSVKASKISRVDFAENPMDEAAMKEFSTFLQDNTKLTHLELSFNRIDANSAKILFKALETNKAIVRLDMSENTIGDEGAKALAELLQKNEHLEKVDVSSSGIKSDGAKALLDVLKTKKSLKKLFFYRNEVSESLRPLFKELKERVIAEFTDDAAQNEDPTDEEEEDDAEGSEGTANAGEESTEDETEDAKEDETASNHEFLKGKKETKHDEL